MTDVSNSRIMKFQLVQRVNCPDVYTHTDYPIDATFREMAELTMNIKRTTYQFFAVRVGRDYVGLDALVHDYRVHKVVFIQQLENPFPSDDTFVEKIAGETPMCIFITTGPRCNRFQEGFYPAFGKLTVKQFMTMIERMGNGCWCSDNEHYWILKDNEVVFLNDHSKKLVQNVITNQMDMIYSRAMVNDADEGFSPRMQPSQWRPNEEHFVCDAVNFSHPAGHPAQMDGYDEDDATITDSNDSPDEMEFDLDTTPVDVLQKLKVKTIDALKPMLKTLYSLEKELLRRGCDGSLHHKFDDILITFPSAEPEDEPDEEEHNVPSTTTTLTPYPTSSAPASSEPASSTTPVATLLMWNAEVKFGDLTKHVSFMPNQTVASFRNDLQKIFGIAPKEQKITTVGGEQLMQGAKHMKSYVSSGVKLTLEVRGRGGGRRPTIKSAMVKEHTMTYKRQVLSENAKKSNDLKMDDISKILTDASAYLNGLYQKLEPNPHDTFALLVAPLSIEQIDKCLEAFKVNRTDARISKMCEVVMGHHLAQVYASRDGLDTILETILNFFDVMMTSAFMKADMEWDWQKAKKVLTHMKELKETRALATSSASAPSAVAFPALPSPDALANQLENTHMSD